MVKFLVCELSQFLKLDLCFLYPCGTVNITLINMYLVILPLKKYINYHQCKYSSRNCPGCEFRKACVGSASSHQAICILLPEAATCLLVHSIKPSAVTPYVGVEEDHRLPQVLHRLLTSLPMVTAERVR